VTSDKLQDSLSKLLFLSLYRKGEFDMRSSHLGLFSIHPCNWFKSSCNTLIARLIGCRSAVVVYCLGVTGSNSAQLASVLWTSYCPRGFCKGQHLYAFITDHFVLLLLHVHTKQWHVTMVTINDHFHIINSMALRSHISTYNELHGSTITRF